MISKNTAKLDRGKNISRDSPTAHFLKSLFSHLWGQAIPYAVLRNYDGLPERIDHDLDLLVADLDEFERVTRNAAWEASWQVVRKVQRQAFLSLFLIPATGDVSFVIQLDAWSPFNWKGITVVGREVLGTRRLYRGLFYILTPGAEAAVSLTKNLLYLGTVPAKYRSTLPAQVGADRICFIKALTPCLGHDWSGVLADLTGHGRWQEIENLASQLRCQVMGQGLLKQPFRQLAQWAGFLKGHIEQYRQPSGLFVVLIGPDGSGKSTVADGLQKYLTTLFSGVRSYHGHFGILPRLRDLARSMSFRRPGNSEPEETGSLMMPLGSRCGRLRSLIYLLYYTMDYVLGHAVMVAARGKGELVIFDRYFYDYLIQPDLTLPDGLLNNLMRLVPQPDVVIYLKNRPAIIRRRKPELDPQELTRQGSVCLQILSRLGLAGHVVETRGTPEETVRQTITILVKKMAEGNKIQKKIILK